MKFFISFIIYIISITIFTWIFGKLNISERVFNKSIKVKYYNFILFCLLLLFIFMLEYGKQWLNVLYGQNNYKSVILGAFIGSIYFKFVPFIFKKR